MAAATNAGNGNRNELSKFIKEAYDEFKSGYSMKSELEKIEKENGYEDLNIYERLSALNLSVIPNPGDGDCLYYSIETYLKLTGTKYFDKSGKEILVNNLTMRQMVADELFSDEIIANYGMTKKEYYAEFIGKSIEWLDKNEVILRTPGSWNNEIGELPRQILAKILNHDIITYTMQPHRYKEYEYEYELNSNGKKVIKRNSNGQVIYKRNKTGKVKSKEIKGPLYLAEGKIGVDKPMGTMYIVNSGNHFEALIPSDLEEIEDVKFKIEEIVTNQYKISKKVQEEAEAKAKAEANAKAKAKAKAKAEAEAITKKNPKTKANAKGIVNTRKAPQRASVRLLSAKALLEEKLKKAAEEGPRSNSESNSESNSNNNSKPAGGAGKKKTHKNPKLTNNQLKKYRFYINAGMNENTARALAISE